MPQSSKVASYLHSIAVLRFAGIYTLVVGYMNSKVRREMDRWVAVADFFASQCQIELPEVVQDYVLNLVEAETCLTDVD
jgi:hypothetical protein